MSRTSAITPTMPPTTATFRTNNTITTTITNPERCSDHLIS